MLQWIRKHRKALAGISVGAGAFFAAISFITYKVMAAEETTASGNNLINIGILRVMVMIWLVFCRCFLYLQ